MPCISRAQDSQFHSLWRPFRGVVEQWPLGICDARTVTLDDMDELEYVTEEFVRRSYLAKWSEHFRFYYLSKMTSQEVAIFKIFDSGFHAPPDNMEGAFTCEWDQTRPTNIHPLIFFPVGCPHAAFEIPSVTSAPPRESVEVRLFVISEY